MIYSLIVISIVIATLIPLVIFRKKIPSRFISLGLKVLSVILFSLGVFRSFLNDDFIWVINGGTYGEVAYKKTDIIQSILRWGHYLSYVVLPCACFLNKRVFKNVAIYFCFLVAVAELFFFDSTIRYFITDSGRAIYLPPIIRYIEYMLELVLVLVIPLILRFVVGHKFDIKNKKEWSYFIGLLPIMLIICMPVYLLQSFFGFTNVRMKPLSFENIMWILLIVIIIGVLHFKLRFKDYDTKYATLIFLALLLFLHYNSIYLMDLVASRLPFQLCNLGAYLVLIAFLIKKQSFFNFIFLANVPGALIALIAVDVSQGVFSFWNIHYYIEHMWVFILPILAVTLKIFDKPKINGFKHFLIGFTSYFIFCVIAGVILNGFFYEPYHLFFNKVNYFYMFDAKIIGFAPFLGFTRKLEVVIGGYTIYPMYMLFIYVFFVLVSLSFMYITNILNNIAKEHFKLRQIKINRRINNGYYERRKKRIPQMDYE